MNSPVADLRVSSLAVRFRQIGEAEMRELPFYNPALQVEAFDFSEFGSQDLLGVLITPWFMNLVLLPLARQPIQAWRYGETRTVALPGGARDFRYGGDPEIGSLWAHSLHSPTLQFHTQAQARIEARLRRAQALTADEHDPQALANPARRALFAAPRL